MMGTVAPHFSKWELSYMIDCIEANAYHYDNETRKRLLELREKLKHNLEKCL